MLLSRTKNISFTVFYPRLQKCPKSGEDLKAAIMRVVEVVGGKPNYGGLVQSTKDILQQPKTGQGSNTSVADFFNLAWQQIATSTSNYARAHNVECRLPAVQPNAGLLRAPFDHVASLLASVTGLQEALAASMADATHGNLQKLQSRY